MLLLSLSMLFACGKEEIKEETTSTSTETATDSGPLNDCDQSVDADCDGVADADDCDPNDGLVYPGATEIPYDGKDNDCAGDGDWNDIDGDGYIGVNGGGDDCDDNDPDIHPGAEEICYDGKDQDCSGDVENEQNNDCDGDGHLGRGADATDCDDTNPEVNPDAVETWYDGVDQDCDYHSDFDADFDGDDHIDHGGGDCDDTSDLIASINDEIWDAIDNDCDDDVDKMNVFQSFRAYFPVNGFEYLGYAATGLDDYDGDGYAELAVASPTAFPTAEGVSGLVSIVPVGVAEGDPYTISHASIVGDLDTLGVDIASADLDNDGLKELLMTSWGSDAVLIYSGTTLQAGGELSYSQALSRIAGSSTVVGSELEDIGDLNGDGITEIALGYGAFMGANSSWVGIWDGATLGAGNNLTASAVLAEITGTGTSGKMAGGFDVDGDGVADLLSTHAGKVGLIPSADLVAGGSINVSSYPLIYGESATSFGLFNGMSGDVDGDGYAEILVSAPFYDYCSETDCSNLIDDDEDGIVDGLQDAGQVYIISGMSALAGGDAADLASITIIGSEKCGNLIPADRSGDFNGDGVADIVVNQINNDWINCDTTFARSHVFSGALLESGTYSSDEGLSYFMSRETKDSFGLEVVAHDADQDGKDDLIVGAPAHDNDGGYLLLFLSQLPE